MFDVITGSGILVFIGDLEARLNAAKLKLKPGGRFIFILYKCNENDIEIRENIHFAHSLVYVQNTAHKNGLKPEMIFDITHEFDYGKPQPGLIVVLKAD
jgi:predicted TPR repeat methyltransferase